MKRVVLIAAMLMPAMALAVPTPTPPKFRLTLPQPLTDPPNLTWAQQLVAGLRNYQFCVNCGGGGGGGDTPTPASTSTVTLTPAATLTPTTNSFITGGTQSETCPDSGDGSPGTLTLIPTASLVLLTVADLDGCNVSLDETGAADGRFIWIQNISSPFARFTDQAGVLELPHDFQYEFLNGHLTLQYSGGQFNQVDANEPSSVALSLLELVDPSDVPALPLPGECAIIAPPTLSGRPLAVICSSGFSADIPGAADPCTCPSTGTSSLSVGPNGSGVVGLGHATVAIGDGRPVTGDQSIGIGLVAAGSAWVLTGQNSISIGADIAGSADDLTGDQAIQFGSDPVSQHGDYSMCIGYATTCDVDYDIGVGRAANPGGGGCIGRDCTGDAATFSFGSTTKAYHPEWIGSTTEPTADCGTVDSGSTDASGTITVSAGVHLSCTLTFNATWRRNPACFAYDETNSLLLNVVPTTTTVVISAGVSVGGDVLRYGCPVS